MATVTPSLELLKAAKIACIQRDTTLSAFFRTHGFHPENSRHALAGFWKGPKANAILTLVRDELGVGEA
jgi:hypothetical protein